MSIIDTAISWAVSIAEDNSHGYDQIKRNGPDYDCSSLVINAFERAGIPVKSRGATYTGNMKSAFVKCGFKAIKYARGMSLIKGDILLNEKHHTALYIGNGKIVQASINEKGTTTGGRTGDNNGKEILVCPFYEYSKGWDYVLRLEEDKEVKKVNIELSVLTYGATGEEVKTVQRLLNSLGYVGSNGRKLTEDGAFGNNTLYAVNNLQESFLGYHDGIVGEKTWNKLLKSIN